MCSNYYALVIFFFKKDLGKKTYIYIQNRIHIVFAYAFMFYRKIRRLIKDTVSPEGRFCPDSNCTVCEVCFCILSIYYLFIKINSIYFYIVTVQE